MLKWFRRRHAQVVVPSDREILIHLFRRMEVMALDVSKLTVAADRNSKAVAALVASHDDPAGQKAVDAAVVVLDSSSANAEAAVALAPAPQA